MGVCQMEKGHMTRLRMFILALPKSAKDSRE